MNAPNCPFQNFQRDGMMQTQVFKGRTNYEPNSLAEAGEDGGPRESPQAGFVSAGRVALESDPAPKLRIRAERFADHYSQARLFYRSQSPIEQAHIASALVFEAFEGGVRARVIHAATRPWAFLGACATRRALREYWSRPAHFVVSF